MLTALTWLVAVAPATRRGELIGRTLGVAIAGALFGPVLGAIASKLGTGATFTAVAGVSLGVVAWTLATEAPPARGAESLAPLREALHDTSILTGLWLIGLPALLFGTATVLVPLRLSDLGLGALAIGAVYLVAAALEAGISPLVGRLSDQRGHRLPLSIGLAASAVGAMLLPWPERAAVLAVVAVLSAAAFGFFWAPAMAMLADSSERRNLDPVLAFALMNLAWAPGQALGSAAGGAIARATTDAVPYLALSALCVATLVFIRRSPSGRPALGTAGRKNT